MKSIIVGFVLIINLSISFGQKQANTVAPDCELGVNLIFREIAKISTLTYENPDLALEKIMELNELLVLCPNERASIQLNYLSGNVYYLMGNLDHAIEVFSNELWKIDESKYPDLHASLLLAIGRTYSKIGIQEVSIEYLKESYNYWLGIDNKERQFTVLMNIAYSYFINNELDTAIAISYDIIDLVKETPLSINQSFAYSQMAELYVAKENVDSALAYVNQAIPIIDQFENNWERSRIELINGEIEYLMGNYSKAEQHVLNSLDIVNKYHIKVDLDSQYKVLALIYSKTDSRKTYFYEKISNSYRDSLNNLRAVQRIGALSNYKKNKDNEISKLKLQNELQQTELALSKSQNKTNNIYLSLIIASFAAFVLSAVLYNNIKKKKIISLQNAELNEANLTKNKLFALLSHDFRGPLANINALIDMFNQGMLDESEFKLYLVRLKDMTTKTIEFTNNILLWSKSQIDGIKINKTSINVAKLIDLSIELNKSSVKSKNINIQKDIQEQLFVNADFSMISLTINNLLTNAIKFSNLDGSIQIKASVIENEAIICVNDQGTGMDSVTVNHLFSTTISSKRGTSNEVGTGIGLMLCKDLITLNNGRIWAESELGKGSTFCIALPLNSES